MIVRRLDGAWMVINQHDHAGHAGDIAAAWAAGPLGPIAAEQHLILATSLHDNGWILRDAEPSLDAETGGPLNFTQIGDRAHSSFYRIGVENVAAEDAVAGYLASLHASGIYSGRYGWHGLEKIAWPSIGDAGLQFLEQQREYRAQLLSSVSGTDRTLLEFETVWRAYMLLQTFDYLSLLCCLGPFSTGCGPVPLGSQVGALHVRAVSPWSVALTPFPFRGAELQFSVPVRVLEQERFADEGELQRALANAPLKHQTVSYAREETA